MLPLLQPDRPGKRAVTAVGPHCVVSKGEQRAIRWRLSHPDECSSGSWNTDSSHETLKHSCARRITLVADAQFGSGGELVPGSWVFQNASAKWNSDSIRNSETL